MKVRALWAAACLMCLACTTAVAAPAYIQGVPDWNQPIIAGPPPALNQGWNAWCVPTATANIMGYYRDKGLANTLGDALVFPNKNAWPVNAPFPSDYQDDTADPNSSNPPAFGVARGDIGWYMNTNDMGQTASPPNGGVFIGTRLTDVKPGLDGSAPGFTGYLPAHGINNATVNNAASTVQLNTVPAGPFTVATVWNRVTAEIDANRPMLIHFSYFALLGRQQVRGTGPANMPDYDYAAWNPVNPQSDPVVGESWTNPDIGHTVTLVGYWQGGGGDASNPFYNAGNPGQTPNAVIVYDNEDGFLGAGGANPRGLPITLPFDATAPWIGNTEIQGIPEPATMTLAALGFAALAWRWRRK